MLETDKAYIAGLIDGEGCISMSRSRSRNSISIYATLHIAMTDIEPIAYVREACGGIGSLSTDKGKRYGDGKWRPMWHWVLSAQQAAWLLRQILPYLRLKATQARLLIELQDIRATPSGSSKRDPGRQEAIYQQMRTLNVRGVKVAS